MRPRLQFLERFELRRRAVLCPVARQDDPRQRQVPHLRIRFRQRVLNPRSLPPRRQIIHRREAVHLFRKPVGPNLELLPQRRHHRAVLPEHFLHLLDPRRAGLGHRHAGRIVHQHRHHVLLRQDRRKHQRRPPEQRQQDGEHQRLQAPHDRSLPPRQPQPQPPQVDRHRDRAQRDRSPQRPARPSRSQRHLSPVIGNRGILEQKLENCFKHQILKLQTLNLPILKFPSDRVSRSRTRSRAAPSAGVTRISASSSRQYN